MEAFRLIIDLKHSCVASHYNRREPISIPKSLHPLYGATVPPASDDTQLAPQANARINLTSVSERATSSHTDRRTPLNIDAARFAATPESSANVSE